MDNYCINKEEEEQIRQLNGQIVMNALAILNNDATESELTQQIVTFTGHPKKDVHHEVKRILDYGVATGFVMKIKNIYSLPCAYETDSGRKCEAAEKFLDSCITRLEELYPDFDYVDYIQNRASDDKAESSPSCDDSPTSPIALDEECETTAAFIGSFAPLADTDDEVCDSDGGESDWSDTDLLSTEVGTRSREDARRIAEFPGTTVDPIVYSVDESSSEDDMDDTVIKIEVSSPSSDDSPTGSVTLDEECVGSSAPLVDTADEVCDSDGGESDWSDTDLLSTEVGTRSREDARRIAEFPGTTVDPVVYCVDDTSSEGEMDDTLVAIEVEVRPKAKKRLFRESDDEGEGGSSCNPPPEKKKRC